MVRHFISISFGECMPYSQKCGPLAKNWSCVHPHKNGRRRWSRADLGYLHAWAGTRPVRILCRYLQRTERALRCKLHKLGLSAKVREGWDVAALRHTCHVGMRTILRYVVNGKLRLQCGDVRMPCVGIEQVASVITVTRCWHGIRNTNVQPFADLTGQRHWTISQLCLAALAGRCRLLHLRITEATAVQFYEERLPLSLRRASTPVIHRSRRGVQNLPCHYLNAGTFDGDA